MATAVETNRISQLKQTLLELQKLEEPSIPRVIVSYCENGRLSWCIAEFEHRSDVANPFSTCNGKLTKKIHIGEKGVKLIMCAKCREEVQVSLVYLQFQLDVWPY